MIIVLDDAAIPASSLRSAVRGVRWHHLLASPESTTSNAPSLRKSSFQTSKTFRGIPVLHRGGRHSSISRLCKRFAGQLADTDIAKAIVVKPRLQTVYPTPAAADFPFFRWNCFRGGRHYTARPAACSAPNQVTRSPDLFYEEARTYRRRSEPMELASTGLAVRHKRQTPGGDPLAPNVTPMHTERVATLPWLRTDGLRLLVRQWERGAGGRGILGRGTES